MDAAPDRPWLREVPAAQTLRQVWAEHDTDRPGPLRWREVHEMPPPADLITSPYDVDSPRPDRYRWRIPGKGCQPV